MRCSIQGERGAPSSISSFAAGGVDAGNIVITAGHSIAIEGQLADNLSSHISREATTGGQSGDITLMSPILHIDGGILSSGITVDFLLGQRWGYRGQGRNCHVGQWGQDRQQSSR